MGYAKYFEDIQKIRDHALSLAGLGLQKAEVNRRVLSLEEMQKTKEVIQKWAEKLVGQLDSLLDLATDPEIERLLEIEKKNQILYDINAELDAYKVLRSRDEVEKLCLENNLAKIKIELRNTENMLSGSRAALDAVVSENMKLKSRNIDIEKKLMIFESKKEDDSTFLKLMQSQGIKTLKK